MYQRILIATDGSELSGKAVSSGIALALALDAEVVAYNGVVDYPNMYFEGAQVLSAADVGHTEQQTHEKSLSLVNAVREEAQNHNVRATAVSGINSGSVSQGIVSAARKHNCDLIVMASHGRNGIGRLLLGSETQAVLTHSHIPVLVLR